MLLFSARRVANDPAARRALAKAQTILLQLGDEPRYCQKYQVPRGKIDGTTGERIRDQTMT
jgi:hypothetical protein